MAGKNDIIDDVKRRFGIVGNSPRLLSAIERAVKVAPIDLSVLVTGESGSGKEFFPKIIHHFGARKHKKYIAVNCGAIPEGTIDSELFGHEKGSFTGAISDRKGYFEEVDGGTIFLDEVAELPLTTQARLLRVLETGEFLKVGSSKVQKTDVRVVAATNVNLLKAVAQGKFREDLYYRLSTIVIEVPPLHDRGDDIFLLARRFASNFSEKYMTEPISFSEEARRRMLLYRWPGNVRQLKNVVEQLSIFDAGKEISGKTLMELLPIDEGSLSTPVRITTDSPSYAAEREMLWQLLWQMKRELEELKGGAKSKDHPCDVSTRSLVRYGEEVEMPNLLHPGADEAREEKRNIMEALNRNGGSRRRAALDLGISERTLYRKIKDYGLE